MRKRPPLPNYNQNEENNTFQKNSNHHRPPPPSKNQLNNQNTTSKGINSPFSSPFNSNTNQQNDDNTQNNPPPKTNYPPLKNNIPPPKKQFNKEQQETPEENKYNSNDYNNNNNYSNNSNNYNSSNNENNNNNENINNNDYQEEKHKTSQSHKTPDKNYSINPSQIPRPSHFDEIYMNNEKMPIYETNIGTPPPHPISFFSTKETQNSSPRFIRSTLNSVPISQSLLNETNLLFGLCIQPFAEIPDYEEQIPKVESGDCIFRCKQCKSYINNKYNICYSQQNKQVAICNLCQYENEFDTSKPGIKNDYFNTDYTGCPELIKPTIDFIAPINFKSKKKFLPHYLFMIDITENSYSIGLPSYVLRSIQTNLDSFDNANNSYIGFGLYDNKNIYFFYVEKNDIRLTIMGDCNDPFCPLSLKKLFSNIGEERDQIEKLLEKINNFISEKNVNIPDLKGHRQISSITGAAIKSGVDALMENGGRVMIFTPNPCQHGFAGCALRDTFKEKDPQKANPFFPQHEILVEIGNKASNNRIVVDQFIFMSTLYDISTMSLVSNLSGGHVEFYNYSMDPVIVNTNFEKLHFDLTRILTRPNYYDCRFMLRFSVGIDCVEILGPFNKKLGEAFQLGGCDPDYCYYYNMRLNETFKSGQKVDIQLVILYNDNYSDTYLRIFNTSLEMTNEVGKIFNNAEVNALAKAMIYKEISLMFRTEINNVKKNLEDKIINSFKYYRVKEKSGTAANQLILPISIRYLPLYIDSFLKTGILSNQSRPEMHNYILYLINKLLREPIYSSMKFLYPKFYRIDNIEGEQTNLSKSIKINNIGLINEKYNIIQKPILLRLSKDIIDFDCAYLIDNGSYIYLFIFNGLEEQFYNDLFGVSSYEEAKNSGITNLDEDNQSDLNQRLINIVSQLRKENGGNYQPVRIVFLEERGINNPILADLLKEDKIDIYDNYPSYLCMIHKEIMARLVE